jgi:putative oxygen-independent coproporphyrinogen III oxidase
VPAGLPEGGPAPPDGLLPPSAVEGSCERALGVYVHVPFCRARCGYCDFTTYTPAELGGSAERDVYWRRAIDEIRFASRVLEGSCLPERPVSSVFFGGGTPTLLPPRDLARVLGSVRSSLGLEPGAEVTVEANPDSVTPVTLATLSAAGFTRVSLGMQSAVPHVLAALDRTHDPDRVAAVVGWAREAGLEVSLDLIYGAPGESLAHWEESVTSALSCGPDHVSAYALVIEPGTRLGARVRRGEVPPTDDDDLADKYELADELLHAAGLDWYEVSNWARPGGHACRHNLGYWRSDDWWGIGPGAHSHVGGVRWWNVRHPRDYADRLVAGVSPAAGREVLTDAERFEERVLLSVRLVDGLAPTDLDAAGRAAVKALVEDGLVEIRAVEDEAAPARVVLTRRGRLLADTVVRALLG